MASPQPSSEATRARQEAEFARGRAIAHHEQQASKLDDAATITDQLVGHRRANSFTELWRQALDRKP